MKNLCILLLLSGSCVFAQEKESEVIINEQRINNLTSRLNNLGAETRVDDSNAINNKILLEEIKSLKEIILSINTYVEQIKDCSCANDSLKESADLNSLDIKPIFQDEFPKNNKKAVNIESGIYYAVIISRRREQFAMKDLNKILLGDFGAIMVQNKKDTWYHIIVNQKYNTTEEAIEKTNRLKQMGYSDAWWVNGSRIKKVN